MFSKIFKNIVEARSLYINRCMFPNITISGILVPVLIHMLLNSLLNFSKKKKKLSCDALDRANSKLLFAFS